MKYLAGFDVTVAGKPQQPVLGEGDANNDANAEPSAALPTQAAAPSPALQTCLTNDFTAWGIFQGDKFHGTYFKKTRRLNLCLSSLSGFMILSARLIGYECTFLPSRVCLELYSMCELELSKNWMFCLEPKLSCEVYT